MLSFLGEDVLTLRQEPQEPGLDLRNRDEEQGWWTDGALWS